MHSHVTFNLSLLHRSQAFLQIRRIADDRRSSYICLGTALANNGPLMNQRERIYPKVVGLKTRQICGLALLLPNMITLQLNKRIECLWY